jgi:hypothetical protein
MVLQISLNSWYEGNVSNWKLIAYGHPEAAFSTSIQVSGSKKRTLQGNIGKIVTSVTPAYALR